MPIELLTKQWVIFQHIAQELQPPKLDYRYPKDSICFVNLITKYLLKLYKQYLLRS